VPLPLEQEFFFISVAAEMLDMHPQTLRKYERLGLVRPSRTVGSIRLYSREELARLRVIKRLVDELGINLAGVQRLLSIAEVMHRIQPLMDESALSTNAGRRQLLAEMRRLRETVGLG
jgi:MerR family transcriptional regulator/heat shock protein HspR